MKPHIEETSTRNKCMQCGNREIHNFSCGYNIARDNGGQSPVLDDEREQTKVLATITQTNPEVLMLPVLRNGELIGKISLRREAVPTDNIPFRFAIGYTVEEGKMSVYEVSLVCSEKNSKICDSRFVPTKCHYHNTGGDTERPCAHHPAVVG